MKTWAAAREPARLNKVRVSIVLTSTKVLDTPVTASLRFPNTSFNRAIIANRFFLVTRTIASTSQRCNTLPRALCLDDARRAAISDGVLGYEEGQVRLFEATPAATDRPEALC